MGLRNKLKSVKNQVISQYRMLTVSQRAAPSFMIIGAQKCGTTSLFDYICQHPNIVAPRKKEIHFYNLNFSKGGDWYREHFPILQQGQISGEATPAYLFHDAAPKRLLAEYPKIKLIVILRDPIKRAYAAYNMGRRRNIDLSPTFESAIDRELSSRKEIDQGSLYSVEKHNYYYLARSEYAEQINHWLKYFPLDQMLFLKSEDFFATPKEIVNQCYNFLSQDAFDDIKIDIKNKGNYPALADATEFRLKSYFHQHNQELSALLGSHFNWE